MCPTTSTEVLQRTATARQRPAWSSLERWLPVDTTFRRSVFARPTPVRQLALLLLIGLLIAALVAFAVGSRRSTLAPYGLARNGDVVASRDGDIYAIDAATSAESLIGRRHRVRLLAGLLARRHEVHVRALGRPGAEPTRS